VGKLNCSHIDFADFNAAVHSIRTLPGLKSLYLNLHDES